MQTIPEFFRDKVILITGATGFLGQALVAKILTDLPDVKRIYLLIRRRTESNGKVRTPADRLENELFTSSVFAKLRQVHGQQFDGWMQEKVHAVEGDLASERLGLSDASYRALQQEVQIFINSGGLVKFDPPIDASLQSNTLGAKHAVAFARGCNDVVFIHVSTAYVCGVQPGKVPEELHPPYPTYAQRYQEKTGQAIPETLEAEIKEILRLGEQVRAEAERPEQQEGFRRDALRQIGNGKGHAPEKLNQQIQIVREKWIERRLTDEGLKRAQTRGWNDTYTYTKALSEQMIAETRDDLPTAIIRQSIMESSLEDPEPGWLGGALRMADPIIVGFGKGRLPDFPGDPDSILDFIPVDFVVNAILAAAVKTYFHRGIEVYHIASGSANPLTFGEVVEATHDHFVKYPMLDKGKPIPVPVWKYPDPDVFQRDLRRKLRMLRRASWLLNRMPSKWAKQKSRRITVMQSALEGLQYYIQIYGPYARLSFEFETDKMQRLYHSLSSSDQQRFNFDICRIDWQHYLQEVHIPGIKRHLLKLGGGSASPRISEPANPEPNEPADGQINAGTDADLPQVEDSQFIGDDESDMPLEYQTIMDLVARQAEAIPNKTALQIKRDGTWVRYSYRQLHEISRQIAFSLWQRGYRKGDRLILFAENQPEWGIAYLAAVQIGVIVIPIDPQTAQGEIFGLADFTEARAILTSEMLIARLHTEERKPDAPARLLEFLNINRFCQPFECGPEQTSSALEMVSQTIPEGFPDVDIHPDTIASIIFTMGTTVDAKGAMLSHRGFLANIFAVAEALPPHDTDEFLSVLPLYHALGFSCSFLMSIYGGATVTYVNTFKPTAILETMRETRTTVLIGVPRLFKLLYDAIERYVVRAPIEIGASLDAEVVEKARAALGGCIRVLVSGGAALPNEVYDGFQQFGLTIYQGYGMTETAPVLSVNPHQKGKRGSVGPAVKGVQLDISNPDHNGVGEIVTKSPSMMMGYYRNPEATKQVIRDGRLYTGDVGYFDADGYLYITGRSKNVIVSGSGKNIYPVELEELYRHSPDIAEICIVGMNTRDSCGEAVHAVIVPRQYNGKDQSDVEEAIREHIHRCSRSLPTYQHLHNIHFWPDELPKTSDGVVHRQQVKALLQEQRANDLQKQVSTDGEEEDSAAVFCDETSIEMGDCSGWQGVVVSELSRLARIPAEGLSLSSRLDSDLGLDSLARVELLLLLESKFKQPIPDEIVAHMHTIGDVIEAVKALQSSDSLHLDREACGSPAHVEQPQTARVSVKLGSLVRFGMRIVYRRYFSMECRGVQHIPQGQPYIIAANHTSHLDTGAIITALGNESKRLKVLAARDYFFNTSFKSWFFGKLLKFLPLERRDNLLQFLQDVRVSNEILHQNKCLLIYPEGTRSVTGQLQPFKAGLGLLAHETSVPIVPAYIGGTYRALPKGRNLPRKSRIQVVFGEPVMPNTFQSQETNAISHEIYRKIADEVRARIEALQSDCTAGNEE